jgi:hypothetical protein
MFHSLHPLMIMEVPSNRCSLVATKVFITSLDILETLFVFLLLFGLIPLYVEFDQHFSLPPLFLQVEMG